MSTRTPGSQLAVRLKLRVRPGSRRSEIVGRHGDALKVSVAAAPEKGKANEAVVDLLAEALGVERSAVSIVAGHASRDKQAAIVGLSLEEIGRRLGFEMM